MPREQLRHRAPASPEVSVNPASNLGQCSCGVHMSKNGLQNKMRNVSGGQGGKLSSNRGGRYRGKYSGKSKQLSLEFDRRCERCHFPWKPVHLWLLEIRFQLLIAIYSGFSFSSWFSACLFLAEDSILCYYVFYPYAGTDVLSAAQLSASLYKLRSLSS